MSSIRLHPKHGVNATVPICFWCGESKNEIALLGAAYEGEAPMHMVVNLDPCDACAAKMATGITLMEADGDERHPEPTGRWLVLKEEALERAFTGDTPEALRKSRKAFLDPQAFAAILRSEGKGASND
jgi:hypothetical protein